MLSPRQAYISFHGANGSNLVKARQAYMGVRHAGLRPVVPGPIVRSARAATTLLFHHQRLR